MAEVLTFDEFEVDPARGELRRDGRPLKIDALVMDLLVYLAQRAGELVTHDELIEHVWEGRAVSDNVVSVCMAKLRKALGHRRGEREYVLNVYGRGYRFVRPVRAVARGSQPPLAMGQVEPAAPPFVGREQVMARLLAALENARSRRGRVCALLGEPGIGKTRAAEALEQHALASGARVAWGRTRDLDGAPPLWPWVEIVRELLAAVSMPAAEAHLGKTFAELSRLLPELGGAAPAEQEDAAARYRLFDAVARLLALSARDAPWVLMLDDLHRGDAASLELLSYLVDDIVRLPVLIAATLRNTEPPSSPAEQRHLDYVLGHRNCERIELARLSCADVAAYTSAVLGRSDEELARVVFAKSEGNAFFMTEMLRDPAQAHERGEELAARSPSLPPIALDLVRQRVRRLGEDAHRILSCAAVLGRSFDLSLLSSVMEAPPSALLETLDEALATDVVVASPEGLGRFAFGHDLIRAVLYDSLASADRTALHLRVGEALFGLEQRGLYVAPAEIAHHFLCALPNGDVMRAVEYAQRAADAAMRLSAFADAAAMLRRALAALDAARAPAPPMRCSLHYRISACLRVIDARESVQELRKAVALAREHKLPRMLALAGQAMVRAPGVMATPDARAVLEDALALLPEDDHALRATVLSYLSWCEPYSFEHERSAALAARAMQHARACSSNAAMVTALRAQLHLTGGRDDEESARVLAEGDRLVAREGTQLRALWMHQANVFRAIYALQRGDRPGVDRALEALGQSADELQHAELTWHYDRMRVVDRMNRGELRDAAALLRELRQRGKRLQLFAYEQVSAYDALMLLRQTAPPGEERFAWAGAARPEPEDPPSILALRLRSYVEMRRSDEARAILYEFARRGFDRLPRDRDRLGVLCQLALAAAALEEREHAALLYALLEPYAERFVGDVSFHSDGSVAHVLGGLSRLLERRSEAIAYFERALVRNEGFGLRARAAESRFELASALIDAGGSDSRMRARALLAQAEETARGLGLLPLLARVQALAARVPA